MWILIAVLIILFVIFGAAYIFMIMPRVKDKGDMELLLCDYAHRGLWNESYPENSIPAFEMAARAGVGIELDIQLSKDKKIMVFHDYDLKRMCGVEGKLCDMTYNELSRLKLGGTQYGIPTLSEVLTLIDGRVPLLIELKGEDTNTELCKRAVAYLDKYDGLFCVESFNPILLSWMKKHRPRFARGQLVTVLNKKNKGGNAALNFSLSNMLLNFLSRPDFIAVDSKIKNSLRVKICSKIFGADVFVWTIRNKQDYIECKKQKLCTIFEKFIP
ncbi:MAG: glycerophosphodiester phosphodiesterase [Ruminococcaceae bacterium]|nr:glycerophosphodiester phosphodiesterase [Oscillospiraceae bacterium]